MHAEHVCGTASDAVSEAYGQLVRDHAEYVCETASDAVFEAYGQWVRDHAWQISEIIRDGCNASWSLSLHGEFGKAPTVSLRVDQVPKPVVDAIANGQGA